MLKQRKANKILSLLITVAFLLTAAVPVFGAASDISGHWAEDVINKWTGNGVISGYPDGTFKPENSITRAEFVKLVSKIFNYIDKSEAGFPDVNANDWYADVVSKAVASGIIVGDSNGNFRPNDPISRQEAAVVLTRAFKLEASDKNAVSKFADAASVASWAKDAVSALAEKGYVNGRPGNIFAPWDNITRAEAVKMLDNIANELIYVAGTYSEDISGSLVVNTPDVVLKDMTIDGDLYLAQGIGDGDALLDGVTVKGRVVVLGGGENSIILNNTSVQGTLVIIKQNGTVRVVAKGSTEVAATKLSSGAKLQTEDLDGAGFGEVEIIEVPEGESIVLEGDFEKVIIAAPEASVEIAGGKVAELEVAPEAAGAVVNIAETASVTTLTASAAVEVTGTGKIETANIKADNVKIEQKPDKVNVDEGITAEVGGETVEGGTTPTTPPSGGGPSPTPVSVSNITVIMTDSATPDEPTDLTGNDAADRVRGISFTTNAKTCTVRLTNINSPGSGSINIDKTLTFDSSDGNITIGVRDLLGSLADYREDISVGTLRSLFGNYVIVTGTITGTGEYSRLAQRTMSVTITLDNDAEPLPGLNDKISYVSKTGTNVTVTIKSSAANTPLAGLNDAIIALLVYAADEVPSKFSIDSESWIPTSEKLAIKDAVLSLVEGEKQWGEITLGDLVGKTMYFKKDNTHNLVYTLTIN